MATNAGLYLRDQTRRWWHLVVRNGDKKTDLPMHSTDLKKGTVEAIKKQLGLK